MNEHTIQITRPQMTEVPNEAEQAGFSGASGSVNRNLLMRDLRGDPHPARVPMVLERAANLIDELQAKIEALENSQMTTWHVDRLLKERDLWKRDAVHFFTLIERAMQWGVNGAKGYDAHKACVLGDEMNDVLRIRARFDEAMSQNTEPRNLGPTAPAKGD